MANCEGKISREHIVSSSFFANEEIFVQGLPWCIEAKKIGLSSLVSKMLCEKHNAGLSGVDEAGKNAIETFREERRVYQVRSRSANRRWRIVRFDVDGLSLERWFLKTLINISVLKGNPLESNSDEPGNPPRDLVEVVFGVRPLSKPAGLYTLAYVGQEVREFEGLKCSVLTDASQGKGIGALFSFRGLKFLLWLRRDPPGRLHGLGVDAEDLRNYELLFHGKAIRFEMSGRLSHAIDFAWSKKSAKGRSHSKE